MGAWLPALCPTCQPLRVGSWARVSCAFLSHGSAGRGSRRAEQGSEKSVPIAGERTDVCAPADVCVSPQLQPEQLDCGAAHLQHPLSIVNPVTATPIFTYSGLTAVAVASVNNYTVVFLGTASGGLLKASGASSSTGQLSWGRGGCRGSPFQHPCSAQRVTSVVCVV